MTINLKLTNINKTFKEGEYVVEAVKSANLELRAGELVALVGPSGSGKTTLLQIAGLLDSATSGQVEINGTNVSTANDETRTNLRKKHIGFIYQLHNLLPEFSALENVAIPLLIQGVSKKEAMQRAQEILQEVELSNRLNHKPAELSGGQQQRVALARAIVTKPAIILADEPTGNLDSELSERIFALLQSLIKQYNISCLMVTHNQELAKKTDRVLMIRDGVLS